MVQHYNEDYFNWQKITGEFGGNANKFKFKEFIKSSDHVLDFGCGGGYLIRNLECAKRSGIEINPVARETAKLNGIEVFESSNDVPDDYVDVLISHNVLEHLECPLDEVRKILKKIKPGGKGVFVILNQLPWEDYVPKDINQHLYTWNPMTLGTFLEVAGFVNIKVDVIRHMWTPYYLRVHKLLGQRGFDLVCRAYARLKRNYQIRAVAYRSDV